MTVHTITRRTGRGPGDETVDLTYPGSEPVPLDLEPKPSEWSSPSRLHIPRHQPEKGSLVWVYVVIAAMAAFAWGVA